MSALGLGGGKVVDGRSEGDTQVGAELEPGGARRGNERRSGRDRRVAAPSHLAPGVERRQAWRDRRSFAWLSRSAPARGPLAGRRVLVPVTAGRERPVVSELEALGAEVTAVGLARIVPPEDRRALARAIERLAAGDFAWLALTSSHAVDQLECSARARTGSLTEVIAAGRAARPGSSRVAAVGPATARALAAAGVEAELVPADRSAEGLLAAWPAPPAAASSPRPSAEAVPSRRPTETPEGALEAVLDPSRAVLLAQGDLAEPTLAAGLAARGWQPHGVVVYQNLPAPPLDAHVRERLASGEFDVVLLTSGSVAERLLAQVIPRTSFVALGPRTAETVASLGIEVAATSSSPDTEALLAAVRSALDLELEPA